MSIIKNNQDNQDNLDKKNIDKKKIDKKTQNTVTIEGLANPPTKNQWSVDKIKDTLEDMLPDLKKFGICTVVNIIIVYIIWKFGSHVIWFNSIPRTLLKAIYPPGYEYVKDILRENMKVKDCHNVIETGGMRQITAVYFPDQNSLFEERKSCCKNLEQPYKPGSMMEMPCWPLSTDSDTVKRLDDMDDNYLVNNKDYTDCIPYIQWMEQSKADAEQAKADAASAAASAASAAASAAQQKQGSQKGGLGEGWLSKRVATAAAKRVGFTPEMQQNAMQAMRGARDGVASSELGSLASLVRDGVGKARGFMDSRQSAANARREENINLQDKLTEKTKVQFDAGQAAAQKQINALESAELPQEAQQISLDADVTPTPLSAEEVAARPQISGEATGNVGTGVDNTITTALASEAEAQNAMLAQIATKQGEAASQLQSQFRQQQRAQTAATVKLEKADAKISRQQQKDDLRTEITAAKANTKLETQFSKARIKMVEHHQKNLIKFKEQIEKNNKMQNYKLAEKIRKQMNQAAIKHLTQMNKIKLQNEKIEAQQDGKIKIKLQKQQMKNLKEMNKINMKNQIDIDKASQKSTGEKLASGAKFTGGILTAIGKFLMYLLTLLPRFFLAFAKWTVGCSWDQDWQGWVLGPNTANSLWANYTLAVKSSISWAIYNCLNMASGNIIMGFLICTVLLVIMIGLIQMIWVSPLSTVWTLLDFTWPPPMKWMSFLGLPILFAINAIIFGILFLGFSIYYVVGFWLSCLFSNKGDTFKSQLRGCTNVQSSLRRLFFLLTIINAFQNLPSQVIVGMILFLLFIEYKSS